jgi:DNA-binding transcriptional regulator YdaS (Cro superfamily)
VGGMNAAQIIEALGDTSAVAADLGISSSAVSNMKQRGLARSQLLGIHRIAERKRPDITSEMIQRAAAGLLPMRK